MQDLNNLDIIILIVIGISALIALSRGLVKEVLSIVGWVLGTMAVIYLLPVVMPFAKTHIANGYIAGAVSSICILVLFFVLWIYLTAGIIGKIRTSKLNGMDRMLGLFFGIIRAFLLIVLFNILVNWTIPAENQSEALTESKYFKIAGNFAKPLQDLIPEETMKLIREKAKFAAPQEENKKEEEKSDSDDLFERLTQPKIEKAAKDKTEAIKEDFGGYKENERDNLDRLIENME